MGLAMQTVARVIGLMAMVGALGWTVFLQSASAQRGDWVQLRGEAQALSLDKTGFANRPADNSAFALLDVARSDWVKSGSLAMREPNLVFLIQRRSVARTNRTNLVDDLREMSELRSPNVMFKNRYYEMTTRFGPLRGVSFEINADGIRKFCTGYHTPGTNRLLVKGFVCAIEASEASPRATACLVDSIRFVRGEDDTAALALVESSPSGACGAVLLNPDAPSASRPEGGI